MEYRLDLTTMDKDTILFVRKNQYALAYAWSFYQNATSFISKRFTENPPQAIYFKAGEGFDSWVDYKLAVEDGKYAGILDPVAACERAYQNGNRLVSQMNVNIPNTRYIDANGYEYYIPLNDGSEAPAYREKISSGNTNTDDIQLEQCSVYNLSLPFEKRHLMDDLKLTFKEAGLRENSITTFNMLTVPLIFEDDDAKVAYIRNALRMATISALDSDSTEFSLPLSPVVGNTSKYIHHGELDVEAKKYNRFFLAYGNLYKLSSDNAFHKASDLITLQWNEITIPPLLSAVITQGSDPRTDAELAMEYPISKLIVFPGPVKDMLIAYDSRAVENNAPFSYNQYAISMDSGQTWVKHYYTQIQGDVQRFFYMPFPKKLDKVVIGVIDSENSVTFYESADAITWTQIQNTTDFLSDVSSSTNELGYYDNLFKKNLFKFQDDVTVYVDSVGQMQVKDSDGTWRVLTTLSTIEAKIRVDFNNRVLQNAEITSEEYNYVYHYDQDTRLMQVGYSALCWGLASQQANGPEPSYDRRRTIAVYRETGTFYVVDASNYTNASYTHKTIEDVMVDTNQPDPDSVFGNYMVHFNPDHVYYIDGKWVIRDDLGTIFAGIPNEAFVSNMDREGGFVYRISEDFVSWFTVRGIKGESLPDSPMCHVYANLIDDRGMVFIVQDDKAYTYALMRKGTLHYNLRVNSHKWNGVKLTQQIKGTYLVNQLGVQESQSDDPPMRIGFPYDLNPNATILLYNGVPILDGSTYVNPKNKRELVVSNMIDKLNIQKQVYPIQYKYAGRKYVAADFSVIIATAEDTTKEVFAFTSTAKAFSAGKEIYAYFNSKVAGDLVLFNGVDHEYEITDPQSIKYTFSRYGIEEVMYASVQYNTVGYTNFIMQGGKICRLQFYVRDKRV
jgi:hypothetical protein